MAKRDHTGRTVAIVGGVALVARELGKAGLLLEDARTVDGRTFGEIADGAEETDGQTVVVPIETPLKARGGVAEGQHARVARHPGRAFAVAGEHARRRLRAEAVAQAQQAVGESGRERIRGAAQLQEIRGAAGRKRFGLGG